MGNAEGGSHKEVAPEDHPALTPFPVLIWAPSAVGRGSPGQGTAIKSYWEPVGLILQGFPLFQELRLARRVGSRRAQSKGSPEAEGKLRVSANLAMNLEPP